MTRIFSLARYITVFLIAAWVAPSASGQYPGAYGGYQPRHDGISPNLDPYNQPPHAAAPQNRPMVTTPPGAAMTNAPASWSNHQPRADWWNQPSVVSTPGMRAGSVIPPGTYAPYNHAQTQESGVWDKIRRAPSATAQWFKGLWPQQNQPASPAINQGQPPVYYPPLSPGQVPTSETIIPQGPATGPMLGPPVSNGQVPFQPSSSGPIFPQERSRPTFEPPPVTSSRPGAPWNAPQGAAPGSQYSQPVVANYRDTMTGQPPVGSRFAQPSVAVGSPRPVSPETAGSQNAGRVNVASSAINAPLPGVSLYDGGEGNRYVRTAKKKKKKGTATKQMLDRSRSRF